MYKTYDLVIVGGGSAGITAAGFAAQLGARVALVEEHRVGGDCTWTGCVPSKSLLKAAKVAHGMRSADRYGLTAFNPDVDFRRVMDRVRAVVSDVYQSESPEVLRDHHVDVFLDKAHFLNSRRLAVGPMTLEARRILLATGAHPLVPPIPGLSEVPYRTYEDIWDLERLPQHLLVVGAGPIGCEMAQAFRRLGSQVTLVEALDRVLPNEEPEASSAIAQVFESEGIELRLGTPVERVWQTERSIHLATGSDELLGDVLLLTMGRRPNVDDLDLEKAGVAYSAQGIEVDDQLRTSQKHIYAAGDCTGGYQFTHYAGWQAFMATRNALLPGSSAGIADRVPWATFTDPEVAHIGLTEAQAREALGNKVYVCGWPMAQVDRAIAEGDTAGFIKIVHRQDGTVLGATIVAGRAGEMIHEWAIALEHGLKVGDIAHVMHVYPTYSIGSMQAAAEIQIKQLLAGTTGRFIRSMTRLIR